MQALPNHEHIRASIGLPNSWAIVQKDYKLKNIIGEGSFGTVVKAKRIDSGVTCAIKCIQNIFGSRYHAKKVLREVSLLRKLSKFKKNIYTPKLLDIIIPCETE